MHAFAKNLRRVHGVAYVARNGEDGEDGIDLVRKKTTARPRNRWRSLSAVVHIAPLPDHRWAHTAFNRWTHNCALQFMTVRYLRSLDRTGSRLPACQQCARQLTHIGPPPSTVRGSSLGNAPCPSTSGRRMWATWSLHTCSLHTCSRRARGTCACDQPRHRQYRDRQRHMIFMRRRTWGTLAYARTLPRWQMSGRRTYRVVRRVLRSGLLPMRARQRRRSLWRVLSHHQQQPPRQQLPVRGKWSPSSSPRR